MITYQVERWEDTWHEMAVYWSAHHKEVGMHHDTVPLAVDLDVYHTLAAQGVLHVVTVRDAGVLVGYHLSLVKPHMRYKTTLHAIADIFYLAPDYRKGLTGYRFFQAVERSWKARGVVKAITGSKVHLDMSPLFERLGYELTETIYTKVLKE